MDALIVSLQSVWADSGFQGLTGGNAIMLLVGLVLLYLAIGKGFEPLLLSNIAFGCLLGNVPKTGFFTEPGYYQRTAGFYEDTDIKQTVKCSDTDTMSELVERARAYWGWKTGQ